MGASKKEDEQNTVLFLTTAGSEALDDLIVFS